MASGVLVSFNLSSLAKEFFPSGSHQNLPGDSALLPNPGANVNPRLTSSMSDPVLVMEEWLEKWRISRMSVGLYDWNRVLAHPALYKKAKRRWAQSLSPEDRSCFRADTQKLHFRFQELDAAVRRKRRPTRSRRPQVKCKPRKMPNSNSNSNSHSNINSNGNSNSNSNYNFIKAGSPPRHRTKTRSARKQACAPVPPAVGAMSEALSSTSTRVDLAYHNPLPNISQCNLHTCCPFCSYH